MKKKRKKRTQKKQRAKSHLPTQVYEASEVPPDPCRNIGFVVVSTDSTAIALLLPFTFSRRDTPVTSSIKKRNGE